MKILVTGFLPFQNEKLNPSQLLVESLCDSENLDKLILPVSYVESFAMIKTKLQRCHYDKILHFGLASGRAKIGLERFAINWCESEYPDEYNVLRTGEEIVKNSQQMLTTDLNLREWLRELKQQNIPAEISVSAGAYVCNCLYYQTLKWLEENQRPKNALFVHLPKIKDGATQIGLDFQDMKKTLQVLIENRV